MQSFLVIHHISTFLRRMSKQRIELGVPFQLAASWTSSMHRNLSGWLASEKLDGIRAMWDGRGNLVSRNGLVFKAPHEFTRSLPRGGIYLDGELWIDRQMFSDVVSIVRSRPDNWRIVRYKIFDGYCQKWKLWNFHDRINACKDTVNASCDSHVSVVEQIPLLEGSQIEITDHLHRIVSQNGEGIILRDPSALYCRSGNRRAPSISPILKVKQSFDDEALVVENQLRCGRKGSIVVRDRGGKIFKIGSGLRGCGSPPPVGSVITFAYNSRNESTGIPRFPRFLRLREDSEFIST